MCLESALMGGTAWWVAPTYKVAAVGWRQLKGLGRQMAGAIIREVDRKVEFPGGGWYQVRSADDPDSLRGEGLDRVILDECAFIAESAWNEALRPALSDRKGSALFVSTPSGRNWFWRLWTRGQSGDDPEWASWRFPSTLNPFLDPAEIESARKDLPERTFRQEYECEFIEESGGVFRNVEICVDADRSHPDAPHPHQVYTMGVDLARTQDFTVITILDGLGRQVYHERFNQIAWERQIGAIVNAASQYHAHVVIDSTGVGEPIYDRVQMAGIPTTPFHFSSASKGPLIDALAMRIEQGGLRLMDVPQQTAELLAYQYELTPSRNVRMNAPAGFHDDCVIALALACHGLGQGGGAPASGGSRSPITTHVPGWPVGNGAGGLANLGGGFGSSSGRGWR